MLVYFLTFTSNHSVKLPTKALFLFLIMLSTLHATEERKNSLSYTDAVALGLVQGITEFLPISSTGHLIIASNALGLDTEIPLYDEEGQVITFRHNGRTSVYTTKDAVNAYDIVIQGGTILAVIIIYWNSLLSIAMGLLGKNPYGLKLGINVLLAFLPAAILGLLLHDAIHQYLFSTFTVILALAIGAILMLWVEHWKKGSSYQRLALDHERELHELSVRQSLFIGFLQCFAMWPGMSRSMMTIVGGYLSGLSPRRAAEFSFLLGLVTLSSASGYKALKEGPQMLKALEFGPVLVGCLVAFISGALAIKWLVNYLNKHGLHLFAWYRLGLALIACYTFYHIGT